MSIKIICLSVFILIPSLQAADIRMQPMYYIGEKSQGLPHGWGIFVNRLQNKKWLGEWQRGKSHGHGVLRYVDKDGIITWGLGTWHQNRPIPATVIKLHKALVPVRRIPKSPKAHWSLLSYGAGAMYYEGQIMPTLTGAQPHGEGMMTFPTGVVVYGYWHYGVISYGRMKEKNQEYVGQISDYKMHGKGSLYLESGQEFHGLWAHNIPNDTMVIIYKNGNVWDGQQVDWQACGFGKMSYPSGHVYEGEMRDNERNGTGCLRFDNFLMKGTWEKSSLKEYSTIYLPDGKRWQGMLREGLPYGRGILFYPNGDRYEGEYLDGLTYGDDGKFYSHTVSGLSSGVTTDRVIWGRPVGY